MFLLGVTTALLTVAVVSVSWVAARAMFGGLEE